MERWGCLKDTEHVHSKLTWSGILAGLIHYLVFPNSLLFVLFCLFSDDAKTAGVNGRANNWTPFLLQVSTSFLTRKVPINPEKAASTSLALWNVRDVLSTDLRSEKIVSCFSHTHTPLDRGSVIFWKQRASLQWGRSLSPAYKGVIPQVRAFAGPSITPPVHSHISDLHSTPNYKPQPLPRLYVAPATARMSFLLQHH